MHSTNPYPPPGTGGPRPGDRGGQRSTRRHAALRETRWDLPAARGAHPYEDHSQPDTGENDFEFTQRQLAGMMMLMAIAEPVTTIVPFSGPSVRVRYTGPFPGRPLTDQGATRGA